MLASLSFNAFNRGKPMIEFHFSRIEIEDEMWPSKAFCRWLIIHRLERGRVKKKLKVDGKSTETIRPNLLLVFAIFPETTNVERISG